jgi:hypothetical protein
VRQRVGFPRRVASSLVWQSCGCESEAANYRGRTLGRIYPQLWTLCRLSPRYNDCASAHRESSGSGMDCKQHSVAGSSLPLL